MNENEPPMTCREENTRHQNRSNGGYSGMSAADDGYRPGRSAHDALEAARRNCWKYDWVIDFDIKGFFDNLDHELLMHAVRKHTEEKWVLMYVHRWLKAPVQTGSGELVKRTQGTPQGGVISPLLANIFLHHAFDAWMKEVVPEIEFERYADDGIVHCKTCNQAELVLDQIRARLKRCKLEFGAAIFVWTVGRECCVD